MLIQIYLWWFTDGWKHTIHESFSSLGRTLSFFSIGSLLRTLFAPYRQISATSTSGSRISAFFDRLVSRFVGASVRLLIMIAGLGVFITCAIVFLALILIWPIVPFAPVIGVIMAATGVMV